MQVGITQFIIQRVINKKLDTVIVEWVKVFYVLFFNFNLIRFFFYNHFNCKRDTHASNINFSNNLEKRILSRIWRKGNFINFDNVQKINKIFFLRIHSNCINNRIATHAVWLHTQYFPSKSVRVEDPIKEEVPRLIVVYT